MMRRQEKSKKKTAIPDAYDRGLQVGDYTIFGNDKKIAIRKKGKKDVILKDAVIYTSNEKQKLLCYRSVDAGKWYVYSLEKGKIISQGKAGTFACTIFFDDGTYFLNDYNAVYDARSGKKFWIYPISAPEYMEYIRIKRFRILLYGIKAENPMQMVNPAEVTWHICITKSIRKRLLQVFRILWQWQKMAA